MDRPEGSPTYRLAKRFLTRPLASAYDLDVVDAWQVPFEGPAIICANHRSFIDSIFLAMTVPRPVSFLAKAEYWDNPRTRLFFEATGQIPVRRGSPGGAKVALDAALAALRDGHLVGLYPEGTRSRDGLLQRGNLGAARLSILTGAPIIPVGLVGTSDVQPIGTRVPKINKRVRVHFGEAIYPDPAEPDRRQLRDLTHQLMNTIASLCGQRLTDERVLAAV